MFLKFFLEEYGYLFFTAISAVCAVVLLMKRRSKYGLSTKQALLFAVVLIASGITGGKLLFYILNDCKDFSGISFFGAILLIATVMPVLGKALGMSVNQAGGLSAPCAAAVIAFVPLGCTCAGCCRGRYFPQAGFRWPAQPVEGFVYLLVLLALIQLEKKQTKVNLYAVFLTSYAILRFFAEFLRETEAVFWFLSENQILSLLTGIVGAALLLYDYFLGRKKHANKEM